MDLVTSLEISRRLGVKFRTVYQWRHRGLLPPPDVLTSPPVWEWATIEEWAKATGRLKGSQRSGRG